VTEEGPPAKILIVEDEALIAREIKQKVVKMGCEVVGLAYGEEAVDLAVETQPDLLLSDINLRHGLSGIDLAKRIQSHMDIPVVFLTAYSDEDTVDRAKTVTPFGYIMKPVDNRELQITIEMSLYKFRVEKELREKQLLLQTALSCIGNGLVFLDDAGRVSNINDDAAGMFGETVTSGTSWIDLLGEPASVRTVVEGALADKSVVKVPPFLLSRDPLPTKLVDGIVGPMDDGTILILRDLGEIENPVKLEPAEQFATLGEDHLTPSESAFCQLLIAPDQEEAAGSIETVREFLDTALRATDLTSIFAGSVVSVSLPYTEPEEGRQIAEGLLTRLLDFSEGTTFSAGLAHSLGGDQAPIELFRRASVALDTARRSGGSQLWVDQGDDNIGPIDLQGGRDYRHVVLLWNVMNALANARNLEAMCNEFCRHLFHVFGVERSALLSVVDSKLTLEIAYTKAHGATEQIEDLNLSSLEFESILGLAVGGGQGVIDRELALSPVSERWVLLLSGVVFSDEDRRFLDTLTAYFSSSLPRIDAERGEEPVAALSERTLVHGSPQMQEVLEAADLAAPTDATVLLMGESGTGKELIATYIHEHGARSHQPLVIVDCGAVAPSLIESELFGHVKGAFTGATSNFKGRLKEADGGTVLLDEVGELPLETQVKLLRFVQDRELAPVGSNQYEAVDARVIAATNKDLQGMVKSGDFREDLFYRLNVFSISVPPLRDRPSDIIRVAEHYLALFAQRYNKEIVGFTLEAEQALIDYRWPGNIRELSNVVNRAVILTKDKRIWPIHLGVFGAAEGSLPDDEKASGKDWRQVIARVVDLATTGRRALPVGRFLEEDFILESLDRHDGVLNRAASAIGVPESTLRRKMQKIEEVYDASQPDRPDNWPISRSFYDDIMRIAASNSADPLDQLPQLLLAEIESRNLNKTTGAQILGVSLPTYRRLAG